MKDSKVNPQKLSREVYKALENIVGEAWISDDRADVESYSKGTFVPAEILAKHTKNPDVLPACVVLPSSTEEIQAIVKICNENDIPYIPYTNGQLTSPPAAPGTLCIHLSRMDKVLDINVENMSATLQPYVSYDALQSESMRKGLWNGGTPSAGGVCKLSSQFSSIGIWPTDFKYGGLVRNVLSVKMILPNGDILVTGSAGQTGTEPFWEYSPGPDLICLFKAAQGSFGIVSEIVIKLHAWVGGPVLPDDIGHPSIINYYEDVDKKTFDRPSEPAKHRTYWLEFPNFELEIKALSKISTSGIGIALTANGGFCYHSCSQTQEMAINRSKDEFFPRFSCNILLAAIASEEQLQYEEKVLQKIAEETNARFLSKEYKPEVLDAFAPWRLDFLRASIGMRFCRDGYYGTFMALGPIRIAQKYEKIWHKTLRAIDRFEETDHSIKSVHLNVQNRGHYVLVESDNYGKTYSNIEKLDKARSLSRHMWVEFLKEKLSPGCTAGVSREPFVTFFPEIGPNSHLLFGKVRKVFNPTGICSLGRGIYTEEQKKMLPKELKDNFNESRELIGLSRILE